MSESITFVAFDMHQDSVTAAWLRPGATDPETRTLPNEPKPLRRFVKELLAAGPARACYEAGPLGYEPQRQFAAWGLPCAVIAPSLIPRRPGDRIKTDKRDAKKLVQLYRSGALTSIRIPTPAEEAARDLVRCREACGGDALRALHRLRKFLLRRDLRCPAGRPGTQAWWRWVHALRLPDPAAQRTLEEYTLAAPTARARWKALDPEVTALATRAPWVAPVAQLRGLRGLDTLGAVSLHLEVFDWRRFGSPRPCMSFVGLVPSEHSTGARRRLGSIPKTGNAHLRRILVEAAWHYARRPDPRAAAHRRRRGQPPAVVAVAQQAEQRLYRRFPRLVGRGKLRPVAATAVARELCGFLWAAMVDAPA
ncbi:MAG TPA: IS110 family transposase [Methylomirabilota bacterium]|nr:IS110 family transposase [Methylomirabilota bacterium]